ncbi:hercynylcysteine sulfoxide lyase [Fodinibius salicampi]
MLNGGENKCAIVTAGIEGIDIDDLVAQLREQKINTSATQRNHGVINMDAKTVEMALRISPHYYNTAEEIDKAVGVIEELVSQL